MTHLDRRALRDAFGTFMTGVTVVTTLDAAGNPIGFTANSFASVSLDPPLLLVSIAKASANFATFAEATGFAINVLAETQKDLSNTFARPVADRFAMADWHIGPQGSPVLGGVSAWFDCSLHQLIDAGDHAILIGQVQAFDAGTQPGLGYYRGGYFTPAEASVAVAGGPAVVVSVLIERAGQVLLIDDGYGGLTLPTAKAGHDGASAALAGLIAASGVEAKPGFIYSVFEDAGRGHQHIAFLCPATRGTPVKGCFVDLTAEGLGDVTDPALRVMLGRLAEESQMGNYGIYFGDQNQGQVRRVTQGDVL